MTSPIFFPILFRPLLILSDPWSLEERPLDGVCQTAYRVFGGITFLKNSLMKRKVRVFVVAHYFATPRKFTSEIAYLFVLGFASQ